MINYEKRFEYDTTEESPTNEKTVQFPVTPTDTHSPKREEEAAVQVTHRLHFNLRAGPDFTREQTVH